MPEEKPFLDGEILTAQRLNAMRTGLSDRIDTVNATLTQKLASHNHDGGEGGPKLGSASLEAGAVGSDQLRDGAVTQKQMDPALYKALKDGPSSMAYVKWRTEPLIILPNDIKAGNIGAVSQVEMLAQQQFQVEGKAQPKTQAKAQPKTQPKDGALAGLAVEVGTPIYPIIPIFPFPTPEFRLEWEVLGAAGNIGYATRHAATTNPVAPPYIRVGFTKAYIDTNYVVSVTSEYTEGRAHPLVVFRREKGYVDLMVPGGTYEDLALSFHLTVFGELAP